jgi:hypothetical protein
VKTYKNKHLIICFNHDHNSTRYKQNINIPLPLYNKVFGQMSVLCNGFKLCQMLNINMNLFGNFKLFKSYIKSVITQK